MKNTDGKLLIVGIILMLLISGAGVYIYNFYVFKTVRLCIGEANNFEVSCEVTSDCINLIKNNVEEWLIDSPSFIQKNVEEIIGEGVYCDGSCFIKIVRGGLSQV